MNIERLLALFDYADKDPDAIPSIRRFVLNLAVRGKLAKQNPADEPASELLKRVIQEKKRLAKAGVVKKNQASWVKMTEAPFSLPDSWRWIALGNIFLYDAGTKRKPGTLKPKSWLLELEDIEKETGRLLRRIATTERKPKSTKSEFRAHDILYGKLRPYLNKVLVADKPGYSTTEIVALRTCIPICPEYCALALRRSDFVDYVTQLGQGTKMPRLRTRDAITAPFPLPPLAEQRRIVAKVAELMELCDQLATKWIMREKIRSRLAKASFSRLAIQDTSNVAFLSHARFAINTLPSLTIRVDQIKQLRQTILNLAVQGKLIAQNPADEPAFELLKRITEKKALLAHRPKMRSLKILKPLSVNGHPFLLPDTWIWTRIANIGVLSPRNDIGDDHVASFVPMPLIPAEWGLKNGHMKHLWGEIKKGYTHFAEGDVGVAKITPCFENGKSVVFQNLTGGIGSGTTELHVVRPVLVNARYIVLFLKSPLYIEPGILKMTGTAGQKRVPKEYFANSPFPLPPLDEQRRIVAKVDELMGLCDRLETNLETANATRQQALDSLLWNVLETNDEPSRAFKKGTKTGSRSAETGA